MAQSPKKSAGSSPSASPEVRAEMVVVKLERFIRENRGSQGVSFRKWQDMAKAEILELMRDAENEIRADYGLADRLALVLGIGLVTIGVWGGALAFWAAIPDRVIPAGLTALGGLMVLWVIGRLGLRSPLRRFRLRQRQERMVRVKTLNAKIRELEGELKKRRKSLEKDIEDFPQEPV